jgi:hypothetical protein
MSYTFLQEQGEESSADYFSDIPPFALSRSSLIAEKYYCKDKETEYCQYSLFGTISKHSTGHHGEEELMLSAAVFPARILALQEKGQASKAKEVGYGKKWIEWFAKWDRILFLWKIPQCSLLEDLEQFSETWPRWGIMRNGVCSELITLEPAIDESESGYVPTPTKSDYKGGCKTGRDSEFKHWLKRRHGGTYPHPLRVEEMMLWPIGWTDLKPLATDKFQVWLNLHGKY